MTNKPAPVVAIPVELLPKLSELSAKDIRYLVARLTHCKEPDEINSFTVKQFLARNQLSRTHYYELKKLGLGPREYWVNDTCRISAEAERDWIIANENITDGKARVRALRRRNRALKGAAVSIASPEHVSKHVGRRKWRVS
jgi:hypothetical protein